MTNFTLTEDGHHALSAALNDPEHGLSNSENLENFLKEIETVAGQCFESDSGASSTNFGISSEIASSNHPETIIVYRSWFKEEEATRS